MKMPFKHLQLLTLGVFLLSSSVFAAANECYSLSELNDFKSLYVKLQQQLNYEGKDAYLDKNFQIQLKAHDPKTAYGGQEFETALFSEYQNSLRKIGKLYQGAKFEGDDSFKSNELLVNFMKSIDQDVDSSDFINKTKINDVIDALEVASVKKFGNGSDKKYALNAGDKYLLKKLLTHAQDRVCSVTKFEQTNKGTALFKADYLQKVKNAPLNVLINTIKNAPIEKDSKIDLKPATNVASLVDPNIAVKSAIADNINQLSNWVKKVKAKGPKCLASIQDKSFANKIQGQIQGCNFGHFIETLGQDNVDNLEAVLHFINANEKLLNNASAKAETNMDELKLEGFISTAFDNLGTQVRCTQIDTASKADKKVFVRNLPYNEKTNKFDTSSILCKSNSKSLSADVCKKQFELVSDNLGRGLEIKPKKGAMANVTFDVKDNENCTAIAFPDPIVATAAPTEESCVDQLQDGATFVWDAKNRKCNLVEFADVHSLEQCMALKKEGSVFNWDANKKSCKEFSALLADAVLKQSEQMCSVKKQDGYAFKWNAADKSCEELLTISPNELKQLQVCAAKKKDGVDFKWNMQTKACDETSNLSEADKNSLLACQSKTKAGSVFTWNNANRSCDESSMLSAEDQKSLKACEAKKKDGSFFKWNAASKACDESPILSSSDLKTKEMCEANTKNGLGFKWDASKNICLDGSASMSSVEEKQARLACEAKSTKASAFKWNSINKICDESPVLTAQELKSKELCEAQAKNGSSFAWDMPSKSCIDKKISSVDEKQVKLMCEAKSSPTKAFKWNAINKICDEAPVAIADEAKQKEYCEATTKDGIRSKWDQVNKKCLDGAKVILSSSEEKQAKLACEAKSNGTSSFKWNSINKICDESPALAADEAKSKAMCEAKVQNGMSYQWNSTNKSCNPSTTSPFSNTVTEKEARIGCESKSAPGLVFKWNSQDKTCTSSRTEGKLTLTNDTKTPTRNPSSPDAGPIKTSQNSGNNKEDKTTTTPPNIFGSGPSDEQKKINCEDQKKEGFAYKWLPDSKVCREEDAEVAKLNCEEQQKEGFEYKWQADSAKCLELPKEDKKEETKPETKEEPKDDKSSDEAEKKCTEANNKWIDESNDGRPGIKWEWDGSKCVDKRPAKDGPKKVVEEEHEEVEAPTPVKKAPARFVPINIPSRQIYLMPGMP